MAEVIMSGLLYDKLARTTQHVVFIGDAGLQGYAPGHPLPPEGPGKPPSGSPPGTWGGAGEPFPTPPIHIPPIVPVPPDQPNVPPPGSPPVVLPGTSPAHPIVPPAAVIIEYPGIGKVVVPKPLTAEPKTE